MLTVLLDTWPENFLYPNDPNILFETVIWVIYNSGPSQSCTDMKVPEVKQKLSSFRIFGPKYNGDDLIKKLIEHVEQHHADKSGNMGCQVFKKLHRFLAKKGQNHTFKVNLICQNQSGFS